MNVKKVILVGAGGHAAEIVDYIESSPMDKSGAAYEIVGLIDDSEANYINYAYAYPYLGSIQKHIPLADCFYVIGIANMKYRQTIIESLLSKGAHFTSFVHPTAIIAKSAQIGVGCVISHNVSLGPKVQLGDFNLINSRCTIGHDTHIGSFNFLSPQVVTGGLSKMGDGNFLGTNAAVLPGVVLGSANVVSAGMIVDKDVENSTTIFHRFKEKILVINS
jgi:acetyltransferase EpsM